MLNKKLNKMKIKAIIIATLALAVWGCTDLEEEVFSVVPASQYGLTPHEIKTIAGGAYATLRGGSEEGTNFFPTCEYVFFLDECVSDEACIPTRGSDWFDGGRYQEAQVHQLSSTNGMVYSSWLYCYKGISSCNFIIYQIENAGLEPEDEATAKAEIRGIRAYYYYLLLDRFGNVPISTEFGVTEDPETSSRAQVYDFVETELTEILPLLQPTVEYGRFTQNVCNTLLARLYINSEVFIGEARWQDCIEACDAVTGYELMPNTLDNFITENQFSKEIIWSIPYDNKEGTTGNFLSSLTYHYNHWQAISASPGQWTWAVNGICGQPGVYSSFEDGDERIASMCEGLQIKVSDGEPIMTQEGYELNYTENIGDYKNALQHEGVRLSKYETVAGELPERDHDWVIMRYAEVLMMKAECLVRTGKAGDAYPIVDEIRKRSGLETTPNPITLEVLDKEWLHEFLFEGLRRSVNIRFGTFFEPWWAKPNTTPVEMAIYPIPETELTKNPKLKQNPGY